MGTLHRQTHQLGKFGQPGLLGLGGRAHRVKVHRQRAACARRCGGMALGKGHRPAGPQPLLAGQGAVSHHERMGLDVGHPHGLAREGRRAARSFAISGHHAVDGLVDRLGHAGGRTQHQPTRALVAQQDGNPHAGIQGLQGQGNVAQQGGQIGSGQQLVEQVGTGMLHRLDAFFGGDQHPGAHHFVALAVGIALGAELFTHPLPAPAAGLHTVFAHPGPGLAQPTLGGQHGAQVIRMHMVQPPAWLKRLLHGVTQQAFDVGADPAGTHGRAIPHHAEQDDRPRLQHQIQLVPSRPQLGTLMRQLVLAVYAVEHGGQGIQVAGVLDQIVAGPTQQRQYGHILAAVARDQHQRHVELALLATSSRNSSPSMPGMRKSTSNTSHPTSSASDDMGRRCKAS